MFSSRTIDNEKHKMVWTEWATELFTNNSEGKEMRFPFSSCNERNAKIRVPERNRTSNLRITRWEGQSQTNRDSKVRMANIRL